MIFRTIAHTEIWEGKEGFCSYPDYSYSDISKWEPAILDNDLNNALFGLGIYSSKYYSFTSRAGRHSFNNTVEETQPSLLKLEPINHNSNHFMKIENSTLKCCYSLVKKFTNFDQNTMGELDHKLLMIKKEQIGSLSNQSRYDSLYFSLDYRLVENILKDFGSNIP
tara:strand:- start:33 stop:530 length:498 start_codon:yes stop_codon:yes gene_type:complete